MAAYLRFSVRDYQAMILACGSIPLIGALRAFQASLVDALRADEPTLADRVAGFRDAQVRVLREQLRSDLSPKRTREAVKCDLNWSEWAAIAQAGSLYLLHGGCPLSFRLFLLEHLADTSRPLAKKLALLDEGQVAELFRRVKSGRRWCP